MPIKIINDYFGFNRQQRRGVAALVTISVLLLLIRLSYPYFIEPSEITVKMLPSTPVVDSSYSKSSGNGITEPNRTSLFEFDPNSASMDELIKLGFSRKSALTLDKFRKKGFQFRRASDLKKVYGLDEKFVSKLMPYVKISAAKPPPQKDFTLKTEVKKQIQVIELNSADSATLVQVKGIGPSYAKRILKYRELLGGYVKIEQLKEVYGFDDKTYESLAPNFIVDANKIKKLDLNKADFKTVNRHPYIGYEITKKIFDWRRKTVINESNLKDILNDEQLYIRLLPYLVF